jgi:plastocyanin
MLCRAQQRQESKPLAELRLHLVSSLPGKPHSVPEVAWLSPHPGTPAVHFSSHGRYTLLQKNRMFTPHLLVIPVGSAVQFPNADPFFHNVFSLFDGKRFDLGLYEAGSSKSVIFSKEGYSYIFCNIHPEMSAVIVALSSPLYSIGGPDNSFAIQNIPTGDYDLHVWIEGVPDSMLAQLVRHVHLESAATDIGAIKAPIPAVRAGSHTDMYGRSYNDETPPPIY